MKIPPHPPAAAWIHLGQAWLTLSVLFVGSLVGDVLCLEPWRVWEDLFFFLGCIFTAGACDARAGNIDEREED